MKNLNLFIKNIFTVIFKYAPIEGTFIVFQEIYIGVSPILEMLALSTFLDRATAVLKGTQEYNSIYFPIVFLVLLVSSNWIVRKLSDFMAMKLELKLKKNYRVAITEKIAKLKYSHIENEESWNLIFKVSKNSEVEVRKAYNSFLSFVSLIIRISGIITLLFFYSWWAASLVLVISVPLFFIAARAGKELYKVSQKADSERRKSNYIGQILTDREFVDERTLFNYGDELSKRWIDIYEKARKLEFKAMYQWTIKSQMGSVITSLISIIILFIFLKPLSEEELTIGVFISTGYGIMDLINEMSWRLTALIEDISKNIEYFISIRKFFALEEEEEILCLPSNELDFKTLEFKNLSFKYPGTDNYIFKNLNLKIENGKHYAIVGANGSGKTTLTKLITGLYDNFEGDILINGKSIRNYKTNEIKGLTSVVYQDFAKYFISLKDNIGLGNINLMEQKEIEKVINEAIETMDMSEKINTLRDGIHSELGKLKEDLIDLSGGQWQRIAMARAIISNAELRILDEPTSALDPISESKVYENFERISKGKTTIFISHRLGSTKLANEIFVLENGTLVEKGPHDELMKLGGVYTTMYESQREWYAC